MEACRRTIFIEPYRRTILVDVYGRPIEGNYWGFTGICEYVHVLPGPLAPVCVCRPPHQCTSHLRYLVPFLLV